MKRLTFDGNFCDIAMCQETRGGSFCEDGYCSQRNVWERLKEYEDAEEQGLLIRLPCKEGTWVYKVCMISVRDDDYAMTWHQEMGVREVRFQASMRDQFGKTVFLTREEAEKALEEV